jgi:hypothetical protein
LEEFGYLAGLISQSRGFKSRTRHESSRCAMAGKGRQSAAFTIRCRLMAGRRTVNPLMLVRSQPPERTIHGVAGQWSGRHPVKVEIAGSNPVSTAPA